MILCLYCRKLSRHLAVVQFLVPVETTSCLELFISLHKEMLTSPNSYVDCTRDEGTRINLNQHNLLQITLKSKITFSIFFWNNTKQVLWYSRVFFTSKTIWGNFSRRMLSRQKDLPITANMLVGSSSALGIVLSSLMCIISFFHHKIPVGHLLTSPFSSTKVYKCKATCLSLDS